MLRDEHLVKRYGARAAVDGLDAVTWRGLGIDAAVGPITVLLLSALVCGGLALWRFRWQS